MERTLAENRELYRTTAQQLADETYAGLGLRAVAEQIQPHLEEAVKLWNNWKSQQLENSDIDFYSSYCGLDRALYGYIGDVDALYQRIIANDMRLQSAAVQSLRKESQEREHNISKTYYDVLSVVNSMNTAKEAKAYLTTLGFDLTELNEVSESSTALAEKVNPTYLFVAKAA